VGHQEPYPDQDPQSEPGTICPRNRLGIRHYDQLKTFEAAAAHRRQLELDAGGVNDIFDPAHLRKIHLHLFQDVFPWAGEFRKVDISKGNSRFASAMHIESSLEEALGKLRAERFLQGLPKTEFAHRAAYYLGEINAIHPFREGNGRTQREFIRQVAQQSGYVLSWAGFTAEQNIGASIRSHTGGDNRGLAMLIEAAIFETSFPPGKELGKD
jgi:cell filamentation protein